MKKPTQPPRKSREFYEARARVAKALAHPSRLLILDTLKAGEACVCELTEVVGADQSTVSKHLSVLKNAGIVGERREGSMTFHHLRVKCLDGFFGCVEAVLAEDLKAKQRELSA